MQTARLEPGTDEGKAVARALRALESAPDLPRPDDVWIAIPPMGTAHACRVEALNVWLIFRVNADAVVAMMVTRQPPVPIDED
jgi:hypothetical protein